MAIAMASLVKSTPASTASTRFPRITPLELAVPASVLSAFPRAQKQPSLCSARKESPKKSQFLPRKMTRKRRRWMKRRLMKRRRCTPRAATRKTEEMARSQRNLHLMLPHPQRLRHHRRPHLRHSALQPPPAPRLQPRHRHRSQERPHRRPPVMRVRCRVPQFTRPQSSAMRVSCRVPHFIRPQSSVMKCLLRVATHQAQPALGRPPPRPWGTVPRRPPAQLGYPRSPSS